MQSILTLKKTFGFVFPLLIVFFIVGVYTTAQGETHSESKKKKVFNLSLAHFQPATHPVETVLIQGWIKRIKKATDGRVKITSYPGSTLLNGPQIYEGIVRGSADIGHSCYAYTRGRFPVLDSFMIPGIVYNNAYVSDYVVREGIKKLDTPGLKDTKQLFTWTTGRGDLLTKEPVKNLDDLSGLRIGVTSGDRAKALKLLGGTGVVLPMPGHFEAISKGVTDGVVAPMETLKSFRLGEVINCVTKTPFLYNQLLFMVMNKETWNSLPTEIQTTIDKVNKKYYNEVVAGFYDKLNKEGSEWAQKEESVKIYTLTESQKYKWKEKLKPLLDEQITKLNKRNLPGKKIMNTILELAKKYNQKYSDN